MFGWLKKLLKDEGITDARKPFCEDVEKVASYLETIFAVVSVLNEDCLNQALKLIQDTDSRMNAREIVLSKQESMEAYALANMYIREDLGIDPADTSKNIIDVSMMPWEDFKKLDLIEMAKVINKREFKPFIDMMEARVRATKMGGGA